MKLKVENIQYNVKERNILNDISFQVDSGEVLAVLGHNGAGKTSLFEIITNIAKPMSGSVLFNDNQTFEQVKRQTGVLWDNLSLFPLLKVKEVIRYALAIYCVRQFPSEQYACLEIKTIENNLMCKLSKGEQKRVELLIATLHEPEFLILDEPTSALDPLIRNNIWDKIILNSGKTVLFSTHLWNEADRYADKILFLYHGQQVNQPDSAENLIRSSRFKSRIAVSKTIALDGLTAFSYETEYHRIYLLREDDTDCLEKIKTQTMNYSVMPVGLEDIYHHLIHKQL